MSMTPLRNNVALAIDGGGIKGYIVARALIALEQELGVSALIEHPQVKVLAGTSTGSIIATAIALGMKAAEIAKLYEDLGQSVFPPLLPQWLPDFVQKDEKVLHLLLQPSLYPSENLVEFMRKVIKDKTGNPEFTLEELHKNLGSDKTLVITTVNILERRTHFLKSCEGKYGQWKLWEAVLASSSAPLALPVFQHIDPDGTLGFYTDGGVGSYGNPGYVATREMIKIRGCAPRDVSTLSFGTGWVDAADFRRTQGSPNSWHIIDWAINAPLLLIGDAARAQSLDIIDDFGEQGLDFRRFQTALQTDIDSDAFANKATYDLMKTLGDKLGQQLINNQYAPNQDREIDPEGLLEGFAARVRARNS